MNISITIDEGGQTIQNNQSHQKNQKIKQYIWLNSSLIGVLLVLLLVTTFHPLYQPAYKQSYGVYLSVSLFLAWCVLCYIFVQEISELIKLQENAEQREIEEFLQKKHWNMKTTTTILVVINVAFVFDIILNIFFK